MSTKLEFHLEGLENRELMAVDVSQSGDQLKIKGDNDGDTVHVQGAGGFGHVQVYVNSVLDGTYTGVRHIRANMRGGSDVLHMSAVRVSGDVTINMGSGEDEFDLDNTVTNLGGSIGVNGNSVFEGDLKVNMGGDVGDWLDWDAVGHSIYVYQNVTIRGASDINFNGAGGSYASENEDIFLNGRTKIFLSPHGNTGGDSAEVYFDDVRFGDRMLVRGSFANDRFRVTDCLFAGESVFDMGGGNDTMTMSGAGDENRFLDFVLFDGGDGSDILAENGDNIYDNGHLVSSFETIIV